MYKRQHIEADPPLILTPIADLKEHRLNLGKTFANLQEEFPQLRETSDNLFRLTDWTFYIDGLSLEDLQKIRTFCEADGWEFTYSSIHGHIKPATQDKATGLLKLLSTHFPEYSPDKVLTLGDSPNDESLFNPEIFPLSVGVANLLDYRDRLVNGPAYITQGHEVSGFCELVHFLTR